MNLTFFQKKKNTTQIYTKETKSLPIRPQHSLIFDSNPQSQNRTQQTGETIPSNNKTKKDVRIAVTKQIMERTDPAVAGGERGSAGGEGVGGQRIGLGQREKGSID